VNSAAPQQLRIFHNSRHRSLLEFLCALIFLLSIVLTGQETHQMTASDLSSSRTRQTGQPPRSRALSTADTSGRTATRARLLREFGMTLSVLTLIMIGALGFRLLLSLPLVAMQ
jgi:hypothetical protein